MNISSATIISILLLLFTICIDFEANFSIFIMIDIFSSLTHDDVILKWTLWLVTCYFLILATLRSDNIRIDEQTNIHEMFYGITIDCDFFSCWLLLVTPCDTIQFFFSSLAWIDLYNRACLYYTYGYFPHECTTRTTWRTNASHILCAYSKFDYYHYNYVITSWFHFYSHCANDIIRFDFHINPKYWYANKK